MYRFTGNSNVRNSRSWSTAICHTSGVDSLIILFLKNFCKNTHCVFAVCGSSNFPKNVPHVLTCANFDVTGSIFFLMNRVSLNCSIWWELVRRFILYEIPNFREKFHALVLSFWTKQKFLLTKNGTADDQTSEEHTRDCIVVSFPIGVERNNRNKKRITMPTGAFWPINANVGLKKKICPCDFNLSDNIRSRKFY